MGFDLDETPIPISDLAGYRVRSEDVDRLATPAADAGRESAVGSSLQLPRGMNRRDSSGLFMVSRAGSSGGDGGGSGVGSFPSQEPGRTQRQQQHLKLRQLLEMESEKADSGSGDGGGCGIGETRAGSKEKDGGSSGSQHGEAYITGVYFPLLSVLMPKWLEQLDGNGDGADTSQKTVLLVSGVGQPRNEEHRLEDNSTEVRLAGPP